jgi:hypothetical protein
MNSIMSTTTTTTAAQRDEERARSAKRVELLSAMAVFKPLCMSSEAIDSYDRFVRMAALFQDRAGQALAQQAKLKVDRLDARLAERVAERVAKSKAKHLAKSLAERQAKRQAEWLAERLASAPARFASAEAITAHMRIARALTKVEEPDAGERRIQEGLAAATRATAV